MNTARVMRAEPDETGIRLRVWVDNERGEHQAVAELRIGVKTLETWYQEVENLAELGRQMQLPFPQ